MVTMGNWLIYFVGSERLQHTMKALKNAGRLREGEEMDQLEREHGILLSLARGPLKPKFDSFQKGDR